MSSAASLQNLPGVGMQTLVCHRLYAAGLIASCRVLCRGGWVNIVLGSSPLWFGRRFAVSQAQLLDLAVSV
jgi:hypothetical protein